ncbi:MAG: hypothetical protein GX465_12550 [Acidobacteria bacterium]|nr:hypothetical protein [Acidobacteriota bacterium]
MTAITEERFRDIVVELIDENPFAIRPVLKILDVVFTKAVPTLAVTCGDRPRLLVNLEFLNVHCRTDQHIKALICHEFLHVVLRHTETRRPFTPARHLAFDAVINAVIHRQYGDAYSSMMAGYYADEEDLKKLLRPMTLREQADYAMCRSTNRGIPQWVHAWAALYDGKLVADDIETLAQDISGAAGDGPFVLRGGLPEGIGGLLGGHDALGRPLPQELQDALDRTLRQMNGSGIWRSPRERGVGANPYEAIFAARNEPMRRWERKTLEILAQHLSPDRHSRAARLVQAEFRVPVLSPRDRRAFMRAQWSPFLPEAEWRTQQPEREGTAQVYLDVSGSMSAEMPVVVALLGRLSRYIRRPFWAFSDVVAPAVIEHGQLAARTTGGTSLACVLEHVARTRPASAVVVTDGYIEVLDRRLIMKASATRLHVLVTRDGSPAELLRAGLPYTQLERMPS